jgi:hypothetical protein
MQTLWPIQAVIEDRQAEIRREVALCRRRSRAHSPPRAARVPWRVRLGWRLVEVGLRLALPAPDRPAGAAVVMGPGRLPG